MPSSPILRTPHSAQVGRMVFRPKAFSAAYAILAAILTGCASEPPEYEAIESYRSGALEASFATQSMALYEKRDWRALVELRNRQAGSHRSRGEPLAQSGALEYASYAATSLGDRAAATLYMKQALDVVIGMEPPATQTDRDIHERKRVAYRLQLSKLLLEDRNRVNEARALMEEFRNECARVGDFARRACDTKEKGGYGAIYREVQAKLGDSAAIQLQQQDQERIQAELATLRDLSKRMGAAQRLADHAGVTRIGAELSDRLAKRARAGRFVAALVELDRAAAFRALGDAASKESSERMARRRMTEGNFGLQLLKEEAKLADEISLPHHAQQLRAEAVAMDSLETQAGLQGSSAVDFGRWAEPQKLLDERAALLSSSDHLQSRGAYLSAEFALDRMRAVSAAYQNRVAEIASERAAAEQIRIEDARREREGWDQFRNALGVAGAMARNIDQTKADAAKAVGAQRRLDAKQMQNSLATQTTPRPNYPLPTQPESNRGTTGQMQSGSARDMTSGNTGGTTGRPNQGTVAGAQSAGSQSIGTAKFQSQDATACMEIVPSGFKCNGPNKRFLVNNCSMKVNVWFKSSGPSGSEGLDSWAPKQCRSIAADLFDGSETRVEWKACSWDPKATFGPSKDPCRY